MNILPLTQRFEMKRHSWISNTLDNTGGWKTRHHQAMNGFGPMAAAFRAWCKYAEAHQTRFSSPIGEDHVLGPAWAKWGIALRALLNGETGGLDCGTCDTIIYDNLAEQGFSIE